MTSVLLVANHGALGGGEVMLLETAMALKSLGLNPVIITPGEPSALLEEAQGRGLETVALRPSRGGLFGKLWGLRRAIRAHRANDPTALIWGHGLGAAAATVGQSERVVHLHRVPDRRQIPLTWISCRGALDVLVPSRDTLMRLPRILRGNAHVLENWTSAISQRRASWDEKPRTVNLGFLGRPAPGKGIEDLVQALKLLQRTTPALDLWLKVAGAPHFVSSEDQRRVARALKGLGDRIENIGWVDRSEFLGRIDLLVCPSRWPESFGLVVAEAMAAGVPVVVSDAGALPEVVGSDYPFVSAAGNAKDLARVLERACTTLGTREAAATAEAAHRRWLKHWSPEAGRDRVRQALTRWGVQ